MTPNIAQPMTPPVRRRLPAGVFLATALALCSLRAAPASSPVRIETKLDAPRNLDFEAGEAGKLPAGWASPTEGRGFHVEASAEKPGQGKLSTATMISKIVLFICVICGLSFHVSTGNPSRRMIFNAFVVGHGPGRSR